MIKNVTDYLEKTEKSFGSKTAYVDADRSITFTELKNDALKIAAGIMDEAGAGIPVPVFMEKSVECIEAFLGVAYTGAFYVPIDINMPYNRVKLILDTLNAGIMLVRSGDEIPEEIKERVRLYYVDELTGPEKSLSEEELERIRKRQERSIDSDPVYAIFTSGSTGVPKGVLVSSRSVINFTEWWCETFEFSEEEVFANQTPFYFDASVKDIYATLRCAATMYIVPKKLFSLPKQLVHFLNEKKITCIDWVPSALCMIVNFKTLEKEKPEYLKKVMFLGEVMPAKQFNMWREALPDVKYANLYGPTEATGDCTYYKVEREISDSESIPIGRACMNTEVLLLDEKDELITKAGRTGEICVRGCSLALGYYNDPEKTEKAFVQNPLQKAYKERIYRTGDLGKLNGLGELLFVSRKDSQIKHMGHRIELGEIETAISAVEGIRRAACLYNENNSRIIAVYEGDIEKEELIGILKERLPSYMLPGVYHPLEEMPVNLNGKIDRVALKEKFIGQNRAERKKERWTKDLKMKF